VQPVGRAALVAEVPDELVGLHVRLGQQQGVAAPPGGVLAQGAEELEVLGGVGVARFGQLDDERRRVDAEAGDAELEPEIP